MKGSSSQKQLSHHRKTSSQQKARPTSTIQLRSKFATAGDKSDYASAKDIDNTKGTRPQSRFSEKKGILNRKGRQLGNCKIELAKEHLGKLKLKLQSKQKTGETSLMDKVTIIHNHFKKDKSKDYYNLKMNQTPMVMMKNE